MFRLRNVDSYVKYSLFVYHSYQLSGIKEKLNINENLFLVTRRVKKKKNKEKEIRSNIVSLTSYKGFCPFSIS